MFPLSPYLFFFYYTQIFEIGSAPRRRFCTPVQRSCIFSAHIIQISDEGHSRPDYQVKSSDLTSEKVSMLVIATPIELSLIIF